MRISDKQHTKQSNQTNYVIYQNGHIQKDSLRNSLEPVFQVHGQDPEDKSHHSSANSTSKICSLYLTLLSGKAISF